MNQGYAQLVATRLLEELRLSLDYQVRQSRRSRSLEQKDVAPRAKCCTFGAGSTEIPGLGCLLAATRITSLSFVSFLRDCSGTWTKAQKVKPHRRMVLKRHPQHKENTTIDASWVKFASGVCPSEVRVCLGFCTEQGLLPHSVPKALHMGLTAPIYSILGLQFTPLLRAWSAGEVRTKLYKLTLQYIKQRLA